MTAGLVRAELVFPEKFKERHLEADAKSMEMDFTFKNEGDKAARIHHYDAPCSCLSAQVKGGKLDYAPGEEGVIRARFDMGNFSGQVDKTVAIWMEGDPEGKPSVLLTVRVHIPELVLIEPKTLKWTIGEKVAAKTMSIKMEYDRPIKILGINGSSERFKHDLKTIREGEEYELSVTPDETRTPGIGVLRIETDCPVARHRIRQAFIVVRGLPGAKSDLDLPERPIADAAEAAGEEPAGGIEADRRRGMGAGLQASLIAAVALIGALLVWKVAGPPGRS